jgi:hypothetical protein
MPYDQTTEIETDERTQRFNDLIERFEADKGFKIDMKIGLTAGRPEDILESRCGTAGCIAGYVFAAYASRETKQAAVNRWNGDEGPWEMVQAFAQSYLELETSEHTAMPLLFAPRYLGDVTRGDVIRALRNARDCPDHDPWVFKRGDYYA